MRTQKELRRELFRRWQLNQQGGMRARASRWRVIHWIILQRLGWKRWIEGRVFWGDSIRLLTGEPFSSGILAFGYSELALTALMIEILKPGMRVVDVGAHLGYEAMLASRIVGEEGRVVSFEPQEQIVGWTRKNLRPFPQARVVQAAAGEVKGRTIFHERDVALSLFSGQQADPIDAREYQIEVVTLDGTLRRDERPVDFLKCDAEGSDIAVLRGATDILRNDKPFLVVEAEMPCAGQTRPRVKEFLELLQPLGYQGLSFDYDGALKTAPLGSFTENHANVAFVHPYRMAHFLTQAN